LILSDQPLLKISRRGGLALFFIIINNKKSLLKRLLFYKVQTEAGKGWREECSL
jgi:hypothetical protein